MPRKTLADLTENPRHVTQAELETILLEHGWTLRPGTRHGTIAQKGRRTFLVPRPHGKHLLATYVRKAAKVIEEED